MNIPAPLTTGYATSSITSSMKATTTTTSTATTTTLIASTIGTSKPPYIQRSASHTGLTATVTAGPATTSSVTVTTIGSNEGNIRNGVTQYTHSSSSTNSSSSNNSTVSVSEHRDNIIDTDNNSESISFMPSQSFFSQVSQQSQSQAQSDHISQPAGAAITSSSSSSSQVNSQSTLDSAFMNVLADAHNNNNSNTNSMDSYQYSTIMANININNNSQGIAYTNSTDAPDQSSPPSQQLQQQNYQSNLSLSLIQTVSDNMLEQLIKRRQCIHDPHTQIHNPVNDTDTDTHSNDNNIEEDDSEKNDPKLKLQNLILQIFSQVVKASLESYNKTNMNNNNNDTTNSNVGRKRVNEFTNESDTDNRDNNHMMDEDSRHYDNKSTFNISSNNNNSRVRFNDMYVGLQDNNNNNNCNNNNNNCNNNNKRHNYNYDGREESYNDEGDYDDEMLSPTSLLLTVAAGTASNKIHARARVLPPSSSSSLLTQALYQLSSSSGKSNTNRSVSIHNSSSSSSGKSNTTNSNSYGQLSNKTMSISGRSLGSTISSSNNRHDTSISITDGVGGMTAARGRHSTAMTQQMQLLMQVENDYDLYSPSQQIQIQVMDEDSCHNTNSNSYLLLDPDRDPLLTQNSQQSHHTTITATTELMSIEAFDDDTTHPFGIYSQDTPSHTQIPLG